MSTSSNTESIIICEDVHKWFDQFHALRGINMEVKHGEVIVIFGPSGSGKSTFIRTLNRLEEHQRGRIVIDGMELGHDIRNIEAIREETGMVFQQFNLFPHLTILQNITLAPIWVRKWPKKKAEEVAMQLLERVGIPEQAAKYPAHLSGGQQQRVAVARAIVVEPDVLLLDEPLSNLDARLRMRTGQELRALQRRLGTTTIYVTHDQTEALSLCDRIAVMADGRVQQVGTPEEVCAHPASRTVAGFIGSANVIPVDRVERDGDGWVAVVGDARVEVSADVSEGDVSALTVHAHAVMVSEARRSERGWFEMIVAGRRFLGADVELALEWNGLTVTALVRPGAPGSAAETGTFVWSHLPPESIWPLPRE